jgi:hypothetical protein
VPRIVYIVALFIHDHNNTSSKFTDPRGGRLCVLHATTCYIETALIIKYTIIFATHPTHGAKRYGSVQAALGFHFLI